MGVGVGQKRVGGLHDQRRDLVGVPGLHGLQHQVGQCGRKVAAGNPPPQLGGQGVGVFVALVALQRRHRGVQAQRAVFGGHGAGQLQHHLGNEVAFHVQGARPRPIHVASDGPQAADGPMGGQHVAAGLVNASAGNQRGGAVGEQTRHLADLLGVNAADTRHGFGVVGLHVADHFVIAVAPLVHERVIYQVLLHDHVKQAQEEGAVRARAQRHPHIRHGSGLGVDGIHHHQLGVRGLAELPQRLPEQGVVGSGGVGAHDHEALGQAGLGIVLDGPSQGQHVRPHAGVPADGANAHVIGGTEQVHEPMQRPEGGVGAADHGAQGARAVLFPQGGKAGGNVVKGFVPAHALPLVGAALPHPLQRMVHAVGAVQHVQVLLPAPASRQDLGVVGEAGGIGLQVHHLAMVHRGPEGTQVSAEVAVGVLDLAALVVNLHHKLPGCGAVVVGFVRPVGPHGGIAQVLIHV